MKPCLLLLPLIFFILCFTSRVGVSIQEVKIVTRPGHFVQQHWTELLACPACVSLVGELLLIAGGHCSIHEPATLLIHLFDRKTGLPTADEVPRNRGLELDWAEEAAGQI